jgi:nitronate monooxygenase
VAEACKAGVIGGLPRQNARSLEQFEAWLNDIQTELLAYRELYPDARIGPVAVNLSQRLSGAEIAEHLEICGRYGVRIIISATGDPTELIKRAHDWGGKVFHDVVNLRFAEKAIRAGADGLTCVGAGGGGHSGVISHLALVPRVRAMFDGTILMAGAISNGAGIRAAEVLGADLAYLGTRFAATREAPVSDEYKALLVSQGSGDLAYTSRISGVAANWMKESMRRVGLDPDNLPIADKKLSHDHLPPTVKPWKNLWSAGQGIDLIEDIPTVSELVQRLRGEYVAACEAPDMADVARLVNAAIEAPD